MIVTCTVIINIKEHNQNYIESKNNTKIHTLSVLEDCKFDCYNGSIQNLYIRIRKLDK